MWSTILWTLWNKTKDKVKTIWINFYNIYNIQPKRNRFWYFTSINFLIKSLLIKFPKRELVLVLFLSLIRILIFLNRKIYVRGLCAESIYDSEYIYNINQDGKVFFMGIMTSLIVYNEVCKIKVCEFK